VRFEVGDRDLVSFPRGDLPKSTDCIEGLGSTSSGSALAETESATSCSATDDVQAEREWLARERDTRLESIAINAIDR